MRQRHHRHHDCAAVGVGWEGSGGDSCSALYGTQDRHSTQVNMPPCHAAVSSRKQRGMGRVGMRLRQGEVGPTARMPTDVGAVCTRTRLGLVPGAADATPVCGHGRLQLLPLFTRRGPCLQVPVRLHPHHPRLPPPAPCCPSPPGTCPACATSWPASSTSCEAPQTW